MSDTALFRVRAYLRAVRHGRRKKVQKKYPVLHLRRVKAELRITDQYGEPVKVVPAKLILNDFSADGVRLYTEEPLQVGQQISLTVDDPRYFYCKGQVRWCHDWKSVSHVLSQSTLRYRIGIAFEFGSRKEREQIRAYYEWIRLTAFFTPAS